MAHRVDNTHNLKTRAAALERSARVLDLRIEGKTPRAIAAELKCNVSTVYRLTERAFANIVAEPAARVIAIELERLDVMTAGLWPKASTGDATAVHAVLRIMERRAKLLGLDQPLEIDVRAIVEAVSAEYSLTQDEKAELHRDMAGWYHELKT